MPTQVGAGWLNDARWVAINEDATIAVRGVAGNTAASVWGDNYYGGLGVSVPAFAYSPVNGPAFPANTQVQGQSDLFTSIEPNGTVKTWGLYPLGYTPANPGPNGGSTQPTTPTGLCPSVPPGVTFPACGPQRAYFQRSGATYVAALHGNTTSPAEIGTYGTTTVIDASQPPYNGTVAFDGVYHVRGDVQFINGTVHLLPTTVFYVDGSSGQSRNPPYNNGTTLDVQNATLRLFGATLQANCPDPWGGVTLTGNGKLYTEATAVGKRTYRPVIRDARTGVYSFTPDWTIANTNEYYLSQTDFLNNDTGLYDLVKGTAQPGEGARSCTFQDGRVGIQLESVDYYPTKVYGGNYDDASFDGNSFKNLSYGITGQAGALHITNNTYTNNYLTAIDMYATATSGGEIYHNTIVVPAVWPAALLAQYQAGYAPESHGINSSGVVEITSNTVVGATTTPTTNSVKQVGMALNGSSQVYDGNVLRYLNEGVTVSTNDSFSATAHYIVSNTFADNVVGLRFIGSHWNGYPTYPVTVTLRCNTFSTSLSGGVGIGVHVTAGAPFPTDLGSSSQPNGNRFDGIIDDTKRFVYDAGGTFRYYRYDSPQERFSGSLYNTIYGSGGVSNGATGSSPTPTITGTYACGGSATGVNVRSATTPPPIEASKSTAIKATLGEAYPNPASEAVTFSYALPTNSPPAVLVLRNLLGQQMAIQPLTQKGTGEVRLSVQHLPAGLYIGTVEVAGQVQVSRKLTIVR
nr:T9SS type A sorting domain-containing protein [Hymenobacter rubidus]